VVAMQHNFLEDVKEGKTVGYIISENSSFAQPKILNTPDNSDRVFLETILQDANVLNRNKRIYTKEAIQSGLNSEYIRERLEGKTWFGESGHPIQPSLERQLSIDHKNMSHVILSYEWRGDILYGLIKAADTSTGDDFNRIVKSGSKVGFSMRGVGSVIEKRNGSVIVKPPMTILTYDFVLHPSHRNAYMTKTVASASPTNNLVTENVNIFELIQKQSINNYIKNNSFNLKLVSESLMVSLNNFTLSEDFNRITAVSEEYGTVVIKTDDFIKKEIKSHLKLL
jgi:hypothetical protein